MNPNAIDTRTVERFSGQPEDFDAWLTRLQVDAHGLNYLDILEGTERVGYGAIPTQADVDAIADAGARAADADASASGAGAASHASSAAVSARFSSVSHVSSL